MKDIVGRVMHIEACVKCVEDALQKGDVQNVRRQIETLRAYMESGQWLADYEADERGELPVQLKRGVLSQDGLYDLLCRIDEE